MQVSRKKNRPPWRVPSVASPRETPSKSYVGISRMDDTMFYGAGNYVPEARQKLWRGYFR
jgi:hypothetical protein